MWYKKLATKHIRFSEPPSIIVLTFSIRQNQATVTTIPLTFTTSRLQLQGHLLIPHQKSQLVISPVTLSVFIMFLKATMEKNLNEIGCTGQVRMLWDKAKYLYPYKTMKKLHVQYSMKTLPILFLLQEPECCTRIFQKPLV